MKRNISIDQVNFYKFSTTADDMPPSLGIDTVQDFFLTQFTKYNHSINDLKQFGIYKLNGWAFDFKPFLRRYVYLTHGSWREMYAPNKQTVVNLTYGRVSEIVEIKNKYRRD